MINLPVDIFVDPSHYAPELAWPKVFVAPDNGHGYEDDHEQCWTTLDNKQTAQKRDEDNETHSYEPAARPTVQPLNRERDEPAHPPLPHTHAHRRLGRLKHVDRFVDRGGTVRHYYRRGGRRIALPGQPGSAEFEAAYSAAAHLARRVFLRHIRERAEAGTFDLLLRNYLATAYFEGISDATLRAHKRVLSGWLASDKMGRRQVTALGSKTVRAMMDRRAATPAAANDLLNKLSQLMRFAIGCGWRIDDPTRKVAPFKIFGTRRPWTTSELAAFQARWPTSTNAGRAFALLRCTRMRPKDIVSVTWADLEGVDCAADCVRALAPLHSTDRFVLTTSRGKPFSAHGFVNFFSAAIRAANLPTDCVAGGLRKSRVNLAPGALALHRPLNCPPDANVNRQTGASCHASC